MNTITTNTQVQATTTTLAEAVSELTKVIAEVVRLAKEEEATSTTTETTATTDAEATETTTVGYLPCPTDAKTAEATTETTTADVEFKGSMIEQDPMDPMPSVENVTAETKQPINLVNLYKVLKYTIEKDGGMVRMDHSPYAPAKNMVADVGNHTIYLSLTDEEVKVIIVKKEYFNPSMTISVNNDREFKEEVKTFYKDALDADTKTCKLIEIVRDIISLTM